jgi:hypothetical protein
MLQVGAAGKRATAQNGKGRANDVRLRPREFLLVVDLQVVAQDTAAWVDIGSFAI